MTGDLIRHDVLLVVLVMASITIFMRVSGFWLMRYVSVTPRVRRAMNTLPGCIIVSVVAPGVLNGGAVFGLSVAAAMAVMWLTRSDFAAIIVGAVTAALLRYSGAV